MPLEKFYTRYKIDKYFGIVLSVNSCFEMLLNSFSYQMSCEIYDNANLLMQALLLFLSVGRFKRQLILHSC